MTTLFLILLALLITGGIAYLLMKSGKIEDANNNNIPDAIEKKVEEVKEVVAEVKVVVEKVKKAVKKPEVKKAAAKKTEVKKTTAKKAKK